VQITPPTASLVCLGRDPIQRRLIGWRFHVPSVRRDTRSAEDRFHVLEGRSLATVRMAMQSAAA
jgi:hypothetical protein